MEAAGLTRVRVAALLCAAWLAACSQPESPDEQLILAVRGNQVAEVERLLAQGANPNADAVKGYEGRPPLFHAATFGYADIARLLIAKGAQVNYGADRGAVTPLIAAALNGSAPMVALLLERGADVDAVAGGATALTEAVQRSDPEVVGLLLAAGADPNMPMPDGGTPYCYAKGRDLGRVAELLRDAGGRGAC
jgi:ankyrin repeat protein